MATILILDDDDESREAMGAWLAQEGHAVFATDRVDGALELIRTESIDVAVVDYSLFDDNPLPVAQLACQRRVPVLFVSDWTNPPGPPGRARWDTLQALVQLDRVVGRDVPPAQPSAAAD